MQRLLIVDGHAYAYRAFYAIRSLNSPTGRPTNAIYGFVKMLAKMRAGLQPSHLLVVWDGGLSEKRRVALPDYKAQRPDMPPDLSCQLDEIGRYLAAARIASHCEDGVEADDFIAYAAQEAQARGMKVVIASADKDFMQLVGPEIGLLNPNDKSESIWAAAQVETKAGVRPEQIVDWLSLLGDAVDNIPGVTGVGPKTATGLLVQFGSVDEMYRRIAEVRSDRIRQALIQAEPDVRRNQALVRLDVSVGRQINWETLAEQAADLNGLAELFREWGFRSLLAEVSALAQRQPELM